MMRFIGAAAVAALCFTGAAAAETAADLRQPTIDSCKTQMGGDAPPGGADAVCTCMVDGIIKDFGDDTISMLKVLTAGLNPSDVKEIATLLGISEADAQAFIDRADKKLDPIQAACMK